MRRIIEYMWMVIGAYAIIEMLYIIRYVGVKNESFLIHLFMFLTAAIMYYLRRRQRNSLKR